MKIGVFDSGLGGLLITQSILDYMPECDLMYLGDTLHVPYGNRSADAIYGYCCRAIDYMFQQDCGLIVFACNTASAACLRRIQQEYLPKMWPDRNVIGVIVPTLEYTLEKQHKHVGLIGTNFIIHSDVYAEELEKISPDITMHKIATPLLVPLIENKGDVWLNQILQHYLSQLDLDELDSLILGCTHYVRLKHVLRDILPSHIDIISQDELIPAKLHDYISRHDEYNIGFSGAHEFCVTDITPHYQETANTLFGRPITIKKVDI